MRHRATSANATTRSDAPISSMSANATSSFADQCCARSAVRNAARAFACTFLERVIHINFDRLECWGEAEQEAAQQRGAEREGKHAPVEADIPGECVRNPSGSEATSKSVPQAASSKPSAPPPRASNNPSVSNCRTMRRPPAPSAIRTGDLFAPGRRARQLQIGDVRTRDQQQNLTAPSRTAEQAPIILSGE
ncbi:MAG: hypothetical protein WKF84_09255 [Pyrinomonadaceae bacterium]